MERSDSVVEFTIKTLRDAICEGRLAQGQRLIVADITKRFDVSAGPVREAIRRLAGEGLVEIIPHRGALVRKFSFADVKDIFKVREALEGLAASLAAENIDLSDNKIRLNDTLAQMRKALVEDGDYVLANHEFHELIYQMSGNERLVEQARLLIFPIYQLRYHHLIKSSYAKISAAEHEAIASAILDGNASLAEQLMRQHIHNSGKAMLRAMETSGFL